MATIPLGQITDSKSRRAAQKHPDREREEGGWKRERVGRVYQNSM